MTAGLVLEGVSIRIPLPGKPRRWVHAADHLDLTVQPGRITAVVGESGCGKSVLASAVLGLLPPGTLTAGRILVDGTEVLSAAPRTLDGLRGRRVALVPQSAATHLTPVRTVGSQLTEHLRRHSLPTGPDHLTALLAGVGLTAATRHAYPHELSGGMAQRVLVAMTLATSPDVLVADEPTSALDPDTTRLVLDALRARARDGGAVVVITHDLAAARDLADDVAVMYAGRFLEVGPVADVLHRPAHDYTGTLLDSLPENGLRPPPGMPASLVDPAAGECAWHRRAGRPCTSAPLQHRTPEHRVACLEPV